MLKYLVLIILINLIHVNLEEQKTEGLIYILLWSSYTDVPFVYWKEKNISFIINNCTFQNCYITKNQEYFSDLTEFDVILFSVAPTLQYESLPAVRSDNQLYIFVGLEPAAYWTMDNDRFDWFFNYTVTYRLDSDVVYPYYVVKNRRGQIVGPKMNARWRNVTMMKPTKQSIIDKLKNKTHAVAWFVTNCRDINKRLSFGHAVNEALTKFNLSVDVYGACGSLVCSKDLYGFCMNLVQDKYYFYFAFENSNSEDYVTEKVMIGLENYAVPIVYGGANYSDFLPDGAYINAQMFTPEVLALKINEIIQDKQTYYNYFRWHRYYTFRHPESGPSDPICDLCDFLNKEPIRRQRRVYGEFRKWWTGYRSQHEEYVVNFKEAAPYFKSVFTFLDQSGPRQVVESPSTVQEVSSILDDVVNYLFGA